MPRAFVAASSQRLELASALVAAVPLTIAAWFRQDTLSSQGLASVSAGASNNRLSLTTQASGVLLQTRALCTAAGTSGISNSPAAACQGRWAHGVAVFASSTLRTAYLNGVPGAANATSLTPASLDNTTVGAIHFNSTAASNPFNGGIADVAMWSVALTDAEVLALSCGDDPRTIRPSGLLDYWALGGLAANETGLKGNVLVNTGSTIGRPRIGYAPRIPVLGVPGGGTAYNKATSGSSTPAGVLTKVTAVPLSGSATPTGGFARLTARALAASSSLAGAVAKRTAKGTLAGSSTGAGSLGTTKAKGVSIAATLAPAGALLGRAIGRIIGAIAALVASLGRVKSGGATGTIVVTVCTRPAAAATFSIRPTTAARAITAPAVVITPRIRPTVAVSERLIAGVPVTVFLAPPRKGP